MGVAANMSLSTFFLLQVGERIRVILDCDDNTLAFERNYEFLGVAFRGKSVYPYSMIKYISYHDRVPNLLKYSRNNHLLRLTFVLTNHVTLKLFCRLTWQEAVPINISGIRKYRSIHGIFGASVRWMSISFTSLHRDWTFILISSNYLVP